jgi:hypothetical protein
MIDSPTKRKPIQPRDRFDRHVPRRGRQSFSHIATCFDKVRGRRQSYGFAYQQARMLGHEDPSLTLRTYADLFDSDLDALADVLDQHRTAALTPSNANGDSESEGENVPGTLQQTA